MLKAVISKPACLPLPMLPSVIKTTDAPVFLQSSSNSTNNPDLVTTKVLSHQPFFQNPYTQKIQNLESELRSILESRMSDNQKALLYQSALNEILMTDKIRKMKPPTIRRIGPGVQRRRVRRIIPQPQPQLPPQPQQGPQPQQPGLPPQQPQLLPLPLPPRLEPQPPVPGLDLLTPPRKTYNISPVPSPPRRRRPFGFPNKARSGGARKNLELELGAYPNMVSPVGPTRLRATPFHNYSDVQRRGGFGEKGVKRKKKVNEDPTYI